MDFAGYLALRYLALNASALLEDPLDAGRHAWGESAERRIHFDDMGGKAEGGVIGDRIARPAFQEKDFACYTEAEIRTFAFDVRKLFLTERAKHLAICSQCEQRLEYWSGLIDAFS